MITGIAAFAYGLLLGSFANVCIWRIPREMSIIRPRSHCTACGKPVPWYLNLPVISYVILRGKCASCGEGFSARYPAVELITAAVTASWFFRFELSATPFIFTAFGLALVIISGIDIDFQIIAPELSYPLIAAGLLLAPFNGFLNSEGYSRFLDAAFGLAAGGTVIWLIRYFGGKAFGREAMGLGDLKLMMGIGAFTGPPGIFWVLFIASILGSVMGLAMRAAGKLKEFEYIPFGPYLAAGAVLYVNLSGFLQRIWTHSLF